MNPMSRMSKPPAEVVKGLAAQGIRTAIIGGTDTHGVMRGKRVPLEQLERLLRSGLALCDVFWVLHVDESEAVSRPDGHQGYFPSESEGYPDIIGRPDSVTARVVPWHEDTVMLIMDWHKPHGGGPIPIDPRNILRTVVQKSQGMGFRPLGALELEFYLLKEPVGNPVRKRPADLVPYMEQPSTYGVVMGSYQEEVASLIRNQALDFGLPIEACNPETGPGQFEINLRYDDLLKAADDAFLFKSAVKEIAATQGLMATFMAKPNGEWPGNSCHLHLSLRTSEGDRGAFYDARTPDHLSATARSFAAGVLATMPELTAIMAPTINSYRRYSNYSWAGTTATWGIDNRSTGLRFITEGDTGTRLEHRQPGGDANPYLAAAAFLASGLHGIEHELEPPPPSAEDVYASSTPALPQDLGTALDLLEGSAVARQWLGDDFVSHFVAMKRAEIEAARLAVTDWEVSRYLEAL